LPERRRQWVAERKILQSPASDLTVQPGETGAPCTSFQSFAGQLLGRLEQWGDACELFWSHTINHIAGQ
jgi:hypothetical protein